LITLICNTYSWDKFLCASFPSFKSYWPPLRPFFYRTRLLIFWELSCLRQDVAPYSLVTNIPTFRKNPPQPSSIPSWGLPVLSKRSHPPPKTNGVTTQRTVHLLNCAFDRQLADDRLASFCVIRQWTVNPHKNGEVFESNIKFGNIGPSLSCGIRLPSPKW
jgi:hypothetical protein